jgi:hypothetical protein
LRGCCLELPCLVCFIIQANNTWFIINSCHMTFNDNACNAFLCELIWLISNLRLPELPFETEGSWHNCLMCVIAINFLLLYLSVTKCHATWKFSIVTGKFWISDLTSPCKEEMR